MIIGGKTIFWKKLKEKNIDMIDDWFWYNG